MEYKLITLILFFVFGFSLCDFRTDALNRHNIYRNKHKSPPLKLNNELNKIAQHFAVKLARQNKFYHSGNRWKGKKIGENLAMSSGKKMTGNHATDIWYNEIKNYNFNNPGFSLKTGHFTQVVWKGTKEVGFGLSNRGNKWYLVANYSPAGNIKGRFRENVLKGLNKGWNYMVPETIPK